MKRTGYLRRRSKTNSRKYENPALVEQYRIDNPLCEFRKWIPELYEMPKEAQEINHIFSLRMRPDLHSNIIHLSSRAHHQFFHAFPTSGRILSIWVKWKKSEIDEEEFKFASGMYLPGWLAAKVPDKDWVERYRSELMEAFP